MALDLRPASYIPNSLNQYSQRTVPSQVDIMGASNVGAGVTANGATTYRHNEFYQAAVSAANQAAAVWLPVNVTAHQGSEVIYNGHVIVPPASQNFQYDADGNLTEDRVWHYTWDAENRLIQMDCLIAGPPAHLTFEYDWQGRRIRKTVKNSNNVMTLDIKFLYDGWNLIAELRPPTSVLRSYLWGLDLSGTSQGAGGVGGLLAVTDYYTNVTTHFVSYDGNGNVTLLLNAEDWSETARFEYGPFGEPIRTTRLLTNAGHAFPIRWSTKYVDDETDLVYYGYRYYSPSLGRWLSRDPIEEQGSANNYQFVAGNPMNTVDALGLRQLGHHYVPDAVIKHICGRKRGQSIFDRFLDFVGSTIGTPTGDESHGWSAPHAEYNERVERLIRDLMRADKRYACNCLNAQRAKELTELVKRSKDPFIQGFLRVVGNGKSALLDWYATKGTQVLARETSIMARIGAKGVRYARHAGRIVGVLTVGTFIYTWSDRGLEAASEQMVKDMVFADEILGGGKWLVDSLEDKVRWMSPEKRLPRWGVSVEWGPDESQ